MDSPGGLDGAVENDANSQQNSISDTTVTDDAPDELIREYEEFPGMPPSEVLVVTAFRWMCQECHDLRARREVARKQRVFQVKLREIDMDNRIQGERKPTAKWALQKQHQLDLERANTRRSEEAELIRLAIEWTVTYAQTVYQYVSTNIPGHTEADRQVPEAL